jgi:hypothetical protein
MQAFTSSRKIKSDIKLKQKLAFPPKLFSIRQGCREKSISLEALRPSTLKVMPLRA